jgi:preprotein translocase subunit YajC
MNETGSALNALLPFLLLGLAFWFLLIRPQRKRAQEAQQVRNALEVGAEVITTSGLYGTVAHLDDDAVLLEVAPGVTNRYIKAAIGKVLTPVSVPDGDEALLETDETPSVEDPGSEPGERGPGDAPPSR